jgi:hypothetical protein
MITEPLPEGQVWFHVVDPAWDTPVDPATAEAAGGRWNPPGSFPTLYLAESMTAARADVVRLFAGTPVHPEDLRDDRGPALARVVLPKRQTVVDVHTNAGLDAAGLARSYPSTSTGRPIPIGRCQAIGAEAHAAGARGVHARSPEASALHERTLAWFPTPRAHAEVVGVVPFGDWWYVREPKPPRPE